ncbi:heavy metal-responsive transcriptional regulator [Neptuniibacter caesariensis]|uniref:Putative transcriptional regulator n=1 Tax=Neptuniibacter caesariensis TaxID=207954 RepID=A0A7U8C788_NEPCE|nr:heavy metal-responsive transcriptional regulator [Neptuniibacter caesariensis]EAR61159.1 putative transcriptional regulator [Oceanospirillum sp. MED92] [Neptuniibacter caesariensis]
MTLLKIGQVAKQSDISVETVRYYEKRGLIPAPQRLDSGYRVYPQSILQRLHFIQRCKDLGFSLQEIGELLNLQTDPATSSALVKEQVENKIQLVKQKIGELQKIEHSLEQLSDLCCGDGPVSDCPIIDFLKQ